MTEMKKYQLTVEQLEKLGEAAKPQMIIVPGVISTPQSRCNAIWQEIGEKMGFKWTTADPYDLDNRNFMAMPKDGEVKKDD